MKETDYYHPLRSQLDYSNLNFITNQKFMRNHLQFTNLALLQKWKYRNYKFKSIEMMQQVLKGPKSFDIYDEDIAISHNMRKQMRIPRALQVVGENTIPESDRPTAFKNQKIKCPEMTIPYQMSRTFIKYMLFYRIMAYLVAFSLIISFLSVYGDTHQYFLTLANNAITFSILISGLIKLKLYRNHLLSKKQSISTFNLAHIIIEILVVIPHPTVWTVEYNLILHLFLIFRVSIIIKYKIQSSIYCNVRAYRIININGLNASQHFLFAVKSLVQSLNFPQILGIQLSSAVLLSHCLYLAGLSYGSELDVFNCLQIILITIPTVGFGDYELPFLGQKIVIFVTVVAGAVFNSFVTLSMLSQLEMNQSELSSYLLYKKIETRESIQNISKSYIQRSFSRIRCKNNQKDELNEYMNFSFKHEYRSRKSLYNSISYTDINNLFAYYSDRLVEFKIASLQTANMVGVLIRGLTRYKNRIKVAVNK